MLLTLCVTVLFQCGQAAQAATLPQYPKGETVMLRLTEKDVFVGYATGIITSTMEGIAETYDVEIKGAPDTCSKLVGKVLPAVPAEEILPANYDTRRYFTGRKEGNWGGPKERWFYIADHIKTIYYFDPSKFKTNDINSITNIRMMASPGTHTEKPCSKAYCSKWYDWADVKETTNGILLTQCKQGKKGTGDREILIDNAVIKARVVEMLRNLDPKIVAESTKSANRESVIVAHVREAAQSAVTEGDTVKAAQPKAAAIWNCFEGNVGDTAWGKFKGKWWKGVIRSCNEDETYEVLWIDGQVSLKAKKSSLRRTDPTAKHSKPVGRVEAKELIKKLERMQNGVVEYSDSDSSSAATVYAPIQMNGW